MRKRLFCLLTCAAAGGMLSAQTPSDGPYYTKHVSFPQNATLQEKVSMAARLVPDSRQLEWQKMELTAFLHFGMNTFTGKEWGDGTDSPALFRPDSLDADQWVRTLREAGFRMVILTAKHHDGFCLWPTSTTDYSVASSPWKGGKGDVVMEVRRACARYGMKFGVYLSPWDRHAPCYGDSPRYNAYFIRQLTELLTRYGEIHEVWFDGANGEGPNGRKQEYDWDAFCATIHRLQPKAVMAIMGDDVRWVGNEQGLGRSTEWSATALTPGVYPNSVRNNSRLGIEGTSADLGSRRLLASAHELFWYPSEVDVSIRPGWFWHAAENDRVKSLRHLADIYFRSVGYNSVLLLNVPPDATGRIHQADVQRLREFADYRRRVFATDLLTGDARSRTLREGASAAFGLKPDRTFNVVLLQEDIARGQRVEHFTLEAFRHGAWSKVAAGTTIGYKRMVRLPDLCADSLRVRIDSTRLDANLAHVAAYYAPPLEDETTAVWNNLPRDRWKLLPGYPFCIDLGQTCDFSSFTYAPLNEEALPTLAVHYSLLLSTDGRTWQTAVSRGEFGNILQNPTPQTVSLGKTFRARYFRLEATTADGQPARVSPAEIGIISSSIRQ